MFETGFAGDRLIFLRPSSRRRGFPSGMLKQVGFPPMALAMTRAETCRFAFSPPRGKAGWFLLLSLTLGTAACSGPKPPAAAPPAAAAHASDFYPLTKGWRWAYDVERDGQTVLATFAVAERDGALATVLSGDAEIRYFVSEQGVAHAMGQSAGDYELREPLARGTTWPVEGGHATVVATGETASVPAGIYNGCVVVEISRNEPPRVTRTTFAPFIGPVIIDQQVVDPAGGAAHTRAVLRGLTQPGSDPFAAAP